MCICALNVVIPNVITYGKKETNCDARTLILWTRKEKNERKTMDDIHITRREFSSILNVAHTQWVIKAKSILMEISFDFIYSLTLSLKPKMLQVLRWIFLRIVSTIEEPDLRISHVSLSQIFFNLFPLYFNYHSLRPWKLT